MPRSLLGCDRLRPADSCPEQGEPLCGLFSPALCCRLDRLYGLLEFHVRPGFISLCSWILARSRSPPELARHCGVLGSGVRARRNASGHSVLLLHVHADQLPGSRRLFSDAGSRQITRFEHTSLRPRSYCFRHVSCYGRDCRRSLDTQLR